MSADLQALHSALIDGSKEIGGVAERSAWWTEALAATIAIRYPGRKLEDLTVAQLLAAVRMHIRVAP